MDKRWHLSRPEELFHLLSVSFSFEWSFVLFSKSRCQDDSVTSQYPDDCAKIQTISEIKGHTRTELLHSQQTLLNSLGCNKASSLCRQSELNCSSYVFWLQRNTNTHSHAHTQTQTPVPCCPPSTDLFCALSAGLLYHQRGWKITSVQIENIWP